MRNIDQMQVKYWQDDMYHKSEMREFGRVQLALAEKQLELARKTGKSVVIAAFVSGTLIASGAMFAAYMRFIPG
jgi:hypothetical protein